MVGLLAVIFPRRTLIAKLYDQERLDDLTLSYVDNLRRTEPANADLAILLARIRQEQLGVAELESLVLPILAQGDARQRGEARWLLLGAYERALDQDASAAGQLRRRLGELLDGAARDDLPVRLAGAFAAAAFRLDRPDLGLAFLRRVGGDKPVATLVANGRAALADGRYGIAAEYFLLARRYAGDRDQARELFEEGIGALMAASRFRQAMQAADRHVGDLADDPATLRYLARTALAAGDAPRAAYYARRLVFRAPPASAASVP
jgi:hypothetical protein